MLIFLITFFISFVGSIHPGPLNLSVIQSSLQKGLFAAVLLAFGGVIPEIIYGYLAVEGVMIFEKYPAIFQGMQWAIIPILWGLGIQQIRIARQPKQLIKNTKKSSQTTASRGFFLSLFNPQLLPYWIIILISYQNYDFLKIIDLSDKIFFLFGTSLGAFALNYLYAYVAHKQRERVFKYINQQHFEKIIGWTFMIMGIFQLVKLAI